MANVADVAIQTFRIGPSLSNRIDSNSNRISKLRRFLRKMFGGWLNIAPTSPPIFGEGLGMRGKGRDRKREGGGEERWEQGREREGHYHPHWLVVVYNNLLVTQKITTAKRSTEPGLRTDDNFNGAWTTCPIKYSVSPYYVWCTPRPGDLQR